MSVAQIRVSVPEPAVVRLRTLTPLDAEAESALASTLRRRKTIPARREILVEGQPITDTLLIVAGWAARVRHLGDGRRQIIGFLLPGDLIGLCDQHRPLASSTVIALTTVTVCAAPARGLSRALDRSYALSRAFEEAHLMAHITRLGRMNARERLADLLLELFERMDAAGCAIKDGYTMPITQETLADALGLTAVHINRTLQTMRLDREIIWKGHDLTLVNPAMLAHRIGRIRTRVSAA